MFAGLVREVVDFDGTEFLVTTDDLQQFRENETIELHLSGTAWNERINWIAGYYSLDESLDFRNVRWGMWEWAVPGGKTVINGSSTQPDLNVAAAEYVRQTAILLGLEGLIQPGSNPPAFSGGGMQTAATAFAFEHDGLECPGGELFDHVDRRSLRVDPRDL